MPRKQHSELVAGVFVLLALAAGLGVLIWLGGAGIFQQRGQELAFFVSQARGEMGLDIGSLVKVNDDAIGKIEAIHFDPAAKGTRYEAQLERKDIRVYANAQAKAVAEFIGGASIILESFGTRAAPPASVQQPISLEKGAGAIIQQAQEALGYGQAQRTQFQEALAGMAEAVENVRDISQALCQEITPENAHLLMSDIQATVANLKGGSVRLMEISAKIDNQLDQEKAGSLMKKVQTIADEVQQAATNIAQMVTTIRPDAEHVVAKVREYTDKDVAAILADLRSASSVIVQAVGELRGVTSQAKDMLVLNREHIDHFILNLENTSANLAAAAQEIRRNPWRLLERPSPTEVRTQNIYDATRAFTEGASQLETAVSQLTALREAHPEGLPAGSPELQKVLADLQGTFEKFRIVEDALWKRLAQQ